MSDNTVDISISELLSLRRDSRLSSPMKDQVNHLLLEFRFLELYTQCLTKWNEALQDRKNRHLREPKNLHIKATLGGATKGLYSTGIKALQTQDCREWESLASELRQNVHFCKPKIWQDCLDFQDCSFQFKFSIFELQKFYGCLSDSLNEFVLLKADSTGDRKVQIQRLKDRLELFIQISEFNPSIDSNGKDVKDFKILIQTWLHIAACQSLLYWTSKEHKEIESKKKIFLSTPEITSMFLSVLRCLWLSSQNRLLMHKCVSLFVDFCLEIFQLHPLEDQEYNESNLRSRLIFLTTFLVDPPLAESVESVAKKVNSLICSLSAKEMKEPASFLRKMNNVIEDLRKLFANIFKDSSSFNFPRTNVLGFVDSVLEKLRGDSDQSRNYEFVIVQQELHAFRDCLGTIMELQKEHHELKDLWTQIVNVVYRVKIVIHLLLYTDNAIGYNVKCLFDVTDEIKLLKNKIKEIQQQENYDIKVPVTEKYTSPAQDNIARISEEFVGFEDEANTIIGKLTEDIEDLKIVSVFGMAGQGKTTLARRIYDNPSVQQHFKKCAWCVVSQTYQRKKLLLEILSGIVPDGDFSAVVEEDLEHILRKRLSGHRYLIVLDDIWDVGAWNALKLSFPDQGNGSRILFTSRIENVASHAKEHSTLHRLRQLSPTESLELLKKKLFGKANFPENFMEVGEQIVQDCNGLPLAIVVIAGILSENVNNFNWWKHIAGSIDSKANDVCMHILELSYKHLPEILKPCFLYLGAFQEDRVIRVRKLIQLWISEGFVQKSNGENSELEEVAKEYLKDLVARSLVLVTCKSSNGGIKTCNIHDLLREFCLKKGKEENFFQLGSWSGPSQSAGALFKNYRICIQTGSDVFFASNPSGPCVHSLLFLPDSSFYMNEWEFFCIGNFKLLQVLDLEEIEFDGYFPEEVVLLVLLRYLAIWCPNGSLSIPPSIANLRLLETFRVKRYSRFGNEVCLPRAIWKMQSLRHIDVGVASLYDDFEPEESSKLSNIQTFSSPSLCFGETAEKLLRRLPNVRKLRCQFDDSSEECNQFPLLDSDDSVLESLNVAYIGKLFHHFSFSFPKTLKKLTLADFKLPWSHISTIGELPELEVLKLLENAFDGETWDLKDEEFPKLKFLKLCNLNIEEWNTDFYALRCLEQLIVEDCYKLQRIPPIFSESTSCLKRIEVRWCNPEFASSAEEVKICQSDYGNEEMEVIVLEAVGSSS